MKRFACLLTAGAAAAGLCLVCAASCGGDASVPDTGGQPGNVDASPSGGDIDILPTTDAGPRADIGTPPGMDASPSGDIGTPSGPDAGADTGVAPGPDASTKADVGAWTPTSRTAACAAPTKAGGDSIPMASSATPSTALAWNGTEAALVFNDRLDIKFQRLTQAGRVSGIAVGLGAMTGNNAADVAVGDGGSGAFVACFDQAASPNTLICGAIDAAGKLTAGLAVSGSMPALAAGPGGLVLVYSTATDLVAQKLDSKAAAVGTPVKVGSAVKITTAIAATPGGYAVAADTGGNTPALKVYRLKPDLSANGSAVDVAGWSKNRVGIAATGEKLALIWGDDTVSGKPQVSSVTIDAANVVGAKQKVDAVSAQFTYGRVDAVGGTDSFALVWSANEANIEYRALDLAGAPQGSPLAAIPTGWDDNPCSIVAVSDGFLLAAGLGFMGTPSVSLMHLGCP